MSRDDPIGLPGRPRTYDWDDALDTDLVARFLAGERVKTIAGALDRPHYVVAGRIDRLRELGRLPYRNKAWKPGQDLLLLAGIDAGTGYGVLARLLERSKAAVRQRAVQLRKARAAADAAAGEGQFTLEFRAE